LKIAEYLETRSDLGPAERWLILCWVERELNLWHWDQDETTWDYVIAGIDADRKWVKSN